MNKQTWTNKHEQTNTNKQTWTNKHEQTNKTKQNKQTNNTKTEKQAKLVAKRQQLYNKPAADKPIVDLSKEDESVKQQAAATKKKKLEFKDGQIIVCVCFCVSFMFVCFSLFFIHSYLFFFFLKTGFRWRYHKIGWFKQGNNISLSLFKTNINNKHKTKQTKTGWKGRIKERRTKERRAKERWTTSNKIGGWKERLKKTFIHVFLSLSFSLSLFLICACLCEFDCFLLMLFM